MSTLPVPEIRYSISFLHKSIYAFQLLQYDFFWYASFYWRASEARWNWNKFSCLKVLLLVGSFLINHNSYNMNCFLVIMNNSPETMVNSPLIFTEGMLWNTLMGFSVICARHVKRFSFSYSNTLFRARQISTWHCLSTHIVIKLRDDNEVALIDLVRT